MKRHLKFVLTAAVVAIVAILFSIAWSFDGLSYDSLWLTFLGGFHPVVLHLPIGVWLVVAVAALLPVPKRTRLILWLMAAFTATGAFVTGLLLGVDGGYDAVLLDRHLWSASAFASLCWVGFLVEASDSSRFVRYGALTASGISMLLAGHYGGVMVHGDPLAAAPWRLDPQRFASLPPMEGEIAVYQNLVTPILGAKCVSCHGPAKQKGRLQLDTLDGIQRGGKSGGVIVAGDETVSGLLASIRLPERDERHMPPEGHPQVSPEELAVLEYWVRKGASLEVSVDVESPPSSFAGIFDRDFRLLPDPEKEAARLLAEKQAAEVAREKRERLGREIASLPEDLAGGFSFVDQDSSRLAFSRFGSREIDSEAWQALEPILLQCESINLSGMQVQEDWVIGLAQSENLKRLNLSYTNLEDIGLSTFAGCDSLVMLNLFGTGISPDWEGSGFDQLRTLYVGGNGWDGSHLVEVSESLADCEVVGDSILEPKGIEISGSANPVSHETLKSDEAAPPTEPLEL